LPAFSFFSPSLKAAQVGLPDLGESARALLRQQLLCISACVSHSRVVPSGDAVPSVWENAICQVQQKHEAQMSQVVHLKGLLLQGITVYKYTRCAYGHGMLRTQLCWFVGMRQRRQTNDASVVVGPQRKATLHRPSEALPLQGHGKGVGYRRRVGSQARDQLDRFQVRTCEA
jgi:hypothetical protein